MKFPSMFAYGILSAGIITRILGADMSVQQMQQLLKTKGYYSGTVDGINGPKTKAALTNYQKDQGLPVTGKLDEKTMGRLNSATTTEAVGSMKGAVKQAGDSTKSTAKSGDASVTGALKEGESSAKKGGSEAHSEAKEGLGAMKGVFGSGTKTTKKTTAKTTQQQR